MSEYASKGLVSYKDAPSCVQHYWNRLPIQRYVGNVLRILSICDWNGPILGVDEFSCYVRSRTKMSSRC